jgi:membrane-bound ClpP family serine protease
LAACLKLASFIAFDIDSSKTRVVAYVPHQARSGVALVALACDETAIGPDAIFGGDGSKEYTADEVALAVETLATSLSHQTTRRWSLPAAILDRNLEVAEYSLAGNPHVKAFFSNRELAAQPNPDLWVKGKIVTKPGHSFTVKGQTAIDFLLADRLARDFSDFKTLYHLENEPQLVTPGWVDVLVRALASPWLASMLLLFGFLAVWKEMQTPGLGIGAIVALLCFSLFFWSRFLGGTAGWLEAILIIIGLTLLAIEIFVLPGFGAFGVFGSLCLVAGFVLASQTFIIPRNSYQFSQMINSGLVLVISGCGTIAVLMATAHLLHEANKPKDTALVSETEKLASYDHLLGRSGITTTPLVPSGMAMIDGELVDVSSDGNMLETGTPIRVVHVRGYRVIVTKA